MTYDDPGEREGGGGGRVTFDPLFDNREVFHVGVDVEGGRVGQGVAHLHVAWQPLDQLLCVVVHV